MRSRSAGQLVFRQFAIFPAIVAAMAAPFGCGARTDMLPVPDHEAPIRGSGIGGSGGASSQTGNSGGAGGSRSGFGGSIGSGGYVYGSIGSGGYVYITGGSGGYVYGTGGSGGYVSVTGGAGGYVYGTGGSGGSSGRSDLGPYRVAASGYVTSGTWSGYAWTTTDSLGTTISPSKFSSVGDGGRLCVKGVVSNLGVEVYAILGINVAQPHDGGSVGVWTPTGSGLAYSLTRNVSSPLRIQIQGAAGYPSESWCVNITGNSGKIAWTQFQQSCWDTYGTFYDGKIPLESVMVDVPGISSTRVSYDFCVDSIGPI